MHLLISAQMCAVGSLLSLRGILEVLLTGAIYSQGSFSVRQRDLHQRPFAMALLLGLGGCFTLWFMVAGSTLLLLQVRDGGGTVQALLATATALGCLAYIGKCRHDACLSWVFFRHDPHRVTREGSPAAYGFFMVALAYWAMAWLTAAIAMF